MSTDKTININSFKKIKSFNKRGVSFILVCLMIIMLLASCSTPKNAVVVKDDKGAEVDKLSTGEYLAMLYQMFSHNNYSAYFSYNGYTDEVLAVPLAYGDDAENKIPLSEHMVKTNIDNIAYLKAVEKMMKDNKIEFSDEDNKSIETAVEGFAGDKLGFNKESYEKSVIRAYADTVLFKSLYGKDGLRAVADADIEKYYKDNILYYKVVEESLTDTEGADLKDAEKTKVKEKLNAYLETYNKDKDFNAIVKKHYDDNKTESSTDFVVDSSKSKIEQNIKSVNVETSENNSLTEQIKAVNFGEAKIVEYSSAAGKKMMAIIYRVNPEDTDTYKFEKRKEDVLFTMKYKAYNEELVKISKDYKVEVDSSVLKKCTPTAMVADMKKS